MTLPPRVPEAGRELARVATNVLHDIAARSRHQRQRRLVITQMTIILDRAPFAAARAAAEVS